MRLPIPSGRIRRIVVLVSAAVAAALLVWRLWPAESVRPALEPVTGRPGGDESERPAANGEDPTEG